MNLAKRIFAIFLIVLCLVSAIPASAHNAYFLSVTIDPGTFEYVGTVTYEDTGLLQTETHTEVKLNAIFSMHTGWSGKTGTYNGLITSSEDKTQEIREFYIGTDDAVGSTGMAAWDSKKAPADSSMAFTFPSYHPSVWESIIGSGVQADVKDEKRAQRVVDNAIKDLNKCLNWIRSTCYKGRIPDMNTMKKLAADVAVCAKNRSGSVSANGCTVSFSAAANPAIAETLTKDDYVTVTITKADGSKSSQDYCRRVPKGYYQVTGDTLWAENKTTAYLNKLRSGSGKDVKYIDWDLIVMQGNYNADVSKVTFATLDEIINPGWFTSLIGSFMKWVITSIATGLQLKPYEDFFLIKNQVAAEYVYGMFPTGWLAPMMLLYTASLTLAMSLIGFSVLKILWKQQLSTVNIGEKIAMQESLKNLIVTLFLFFAFIPIFIFLAGLNVTLVELFGSTISSNTLTGIVTVSYISFGSILLGVAELVLQIYFNFFYVVRGITIAVLVGISPLAIYTISLGGKLAGVFTAFMKELISHIFTQSVHAIMAAFFFNALSLTMMTPFEKIVVLISFIPITKFVKTKVFQLTEGPPSQVAATGTKMATSAASGAAKGLGGGGGGARGGSGSGGTGGNSGGSGGSGSSSSVLGSTIDRTASSQRSSNAAAARANSKVTMADPTPARAGGSPIGAPGGGIAGGLPPAGGAPLGLPGGGGGLVPSGGGAMTPAGGGGMVDAGAGRGTPGHGQAAGWKDINTHEMDRTAASQYGKAVLGAAGQGLKASLYGGMALGMAAIGEDPSRFAEEAARSGVQGQMQFHDANKEMLLYAQAGGLRDQEIMRMQQAGIGGMSTNGNTMNYRVDPRGADAYHSKMYDDMRKAYDFQDGKTEFTQQQLAAQDYYRNNYGVTGVTMGSNGQMSINMDKNKMDAHRINTSDPFTQMKTFSWRDEPKSQERAGGGSSGGDGDSSGPATPPPPRRGSGIQDYGGVSGSDYHTRYDIDTSTANARHQSLYTDFANAYQKPDGKDDFTAKQKSAQTYYRKNYGVEDVSFSGSGDEARMHVVMNNATMSGAGLTPDDPFGRMDKFGSSNPNKKRD